MILPEWLRALTDVQAIIQWGGVLGIALVVFVETGLFVGFFLPGDSLLVTAGILAAAGHLDLSLLLVLTTLAAIVGDQVGYGIGRRAGEALYRRPDSRWFRRSHLERAHAFYEKYGAKTIVLARFVPIVRTFAPAVAGAALMHYRRFVTYNVVGGFLWVFSMVLTGYMLGRAVPHIQKYLHWVIALVVFLSILPGIIEAWRNARVARRALRPVSTEVSRRVSSSPSVE
ncbi:MAG: VTT domain-containing protein [Acidobacteria bacterium]|nr:VTT domain-containing protein [Acidobacteriota bacterium]MDW7984909.1 VTT domain-containing protein [Acidobacteriota bacterium]